MVRDVYSLKAACNDEAIKSYIQCSGNMLLVLK